MKNHFISRRFLRIKALQHLYAYTICQQVYKKQAIEQIKKDFVFDIFFDEPLTKGQLETQEKQAISCFLDMIEHNLLNASLKHSTPTKVSNSVKKNFFHYNQKVAQEQQYLISRLHQAQEYIYKDYLYSLWLLIECYKLALQHSCTIPNSTTASLEKVLTQNPILKTLYQNQNWLDLINQKYNSWPIDDNLIKGAYITLQSCPKLQAIQPTTHPEHSMHILAYLFQMLMVKNKHIKDFLVMQDPYWNEHQYIVKKLLMCTFPCILSKDLLNFKSLLNDLKNEWERVELFYNLLLKTTIKHDQDYETMISTQSKKWDYSRIILIDKIILKLALGEVLYIKETPVKVAMNEYIEIAKVYGTPKSSQFINGILEGIFQHLKLNHKDTLNLFI